MNIGLINYFNRYDEYPTKYSLATMRLAAHLRTHGYDVDLLPISLDEPNSKEIQSFLSRKEYEVIGISNYSWTDKYAQVLSKQIARDYPNAQVVIGGPETANIDFKNWNNELFVLGEGEKSLLNICRYVEGDKKDSEFFINNPNIFNKRNPNGVKTEVDSIHAASFFLSLDGENEEFLWYETSRGCSYNCGYCGHKTRKKVGMLDEGLVAKEIEEIGRRGTKKVFVVDPNFGGDKERGKVILEQFNKNAPNASLIMYLRPEFVDDQYIEILKNANIEEIRIGIQTLNKNVPMWIRSNSTKAIEEQLPKLSENNIPWKAELIVGLPGDNKQGLLESINFVERKLKPAQYACYHLTAIKGTKMYNLVNNFENDLWLKVDDASRAYSSSTYSNDELKDMLKLADIRTNQYNNPINKIVSRSR